MPDSINSPARRTLRTALALLVLVAISPHAIAQLPFGQPKPTVIENARVVLANGRVIEGAKIVIQGGRIGRIGPDIETPDNARTIDADGRTVTPGLIDVGGSLGMTPTSGSSSPRSQAADSFDRYASADFRDALRNGVTSLYVPATGGLGITGTGAVIRLKEGEDGGTGEVLSDEVALCIDLGSGAGPSDRLATYQEIRKRFQAALDYRESLDIYDEELEEYVKKVKERAKKKEQEKEDGDEDGDSPGEEKGEDKEETPAPDETPDEGDEPKPDEPEPDEPDPDEPDPDEPEEEEPTPDEPDEGESFAFQDEGGDAPEGDGDNGNDGDTNDEKKKDDLKRPKKPTPDRDADMLLRVLDRELPARIVAHRSADILNALDLKDEFKIDIILEGGTEAYLVADQLAEAEVPVVLTPAIRSGAYRNDEYQNRVSWNAAALEKAGVEWFVGSGAEQGLATRFVLLQAQMASQGTGRDPIRMTTTDAANLLGTQNGRIQPALPADLVIWDGDPLDPSVAAWIVLIDGEPAYRGRSRRGN